MTTPSSTPTTKTVTSGVKTILGWTWIVFFVFIIIVFIFSGSGKSKEKKPGNKNKNQIESVDRSTLPNTVIEYKLLVKGAEPIRVQKDGYKCDFYGGGKQYYNQPQNSPKHIWGGGNPCDSKEDYPYASYADISYYNEEITVMCVYTKQ